MVVLVAVVAIDGVFVALYHQTLIKSTLDSPPIPFGVCGAYTHILKICK